MRDTTLGDHSLFVPFAMLAAETRGVEADDQDSVDFPLSVSLERHSPVNHRDALLDRYDLELAGDIRLRIFEPARHDRVASPCRRTKGTVEIDGVFGEE